MTMMTLRGLPVLALVSVLLAAARVEAGVEEDVRATMERFVAAQNAHDLGAVRDLLADSPHFLWITRGTPIWGRQAALARFEALYRGTWKLEPAMSELRVVMLGDGAAQIYVPIAFTIGPPGEPPTTTRFLMNQVLLKTGNGWRVTSILPIPAAAETSR
jgi:ketosteroid isomerase-like protein